MRSKLTSLRSVGRVLTLVVGLLAAACATPEPAAPAHPSLSVTPGSAQAVTATGLAVEVLVDGLEHPWDVAETPDGLLLLTERGGRISTVTAAGDHAEVRAELGDLFVRGETGLMGVAADPDFARNRRFYTCQGNAPEHDIRVVAWRLAADARSAERVDDLVTGLPLSSGRHGGCRLRFDTEGRLYISAGDAARGPLPQDLTSLGGKVLRVDPTDGSPADGNPFLDAEHHATRLIYTYGHRNVQGLALRSDGTIYAAEHGPGTDDEVNRLQAGGNYGWNPDGRFGYDESVPMTDLELPGAVPAVWSSGRPTLAISGSGFLAGEAWGDRDGRLAVAALRGSRLLIFDLAADGAVRAVEQPPELDGTRGRLRTVQPAAGAAVFYVTTDNGTDDKLLRVTPAP